MADYSQGLLSGAQTAFDREEERKRKQTNSISLNTALPTDSRQDPLATRNVDGTPAEPVKVDDQGRIISDRQQFDPTGNPTGSGMSATNTKPNTLSVYDPQGGVHDNPLYSYSSAEEVNPAEIERLRMSATMGQDGPQLMGYQKAIANQLLDNDASGPSNEREALIHAVNFDPDKPYIRPVDPTAYAVSDLQRQAGQNIGSMLDHYSQGREAPTADRARIDTRIGGGASTQADQQERTVIGNAQGYNAARITDVGPVGTARIAPVVNATSANMGPASLSSAAQIDKDPQAQLRDVQVKQANRLNNTASGEGPSLVGSQLQKGLDSALADQVSGAQSIRGFGNAGSAQRNLANKAAYMQANSAGKSAELGIAERLGAEGQLISSITSARSQDIGLAGQQAGLDQQTNLSNQAAVNRREEVQSAQDASVSSQNAQQANSLASELAKLEQGALSQTSAQRAQLAQRQAELDTTALSDYSKAVNAGTMSQAELDASRNAADQAANNRLNEALLNRDQQMKVAQLDADGRINLADLDSKLKVMGYDDNARLQLLGAEINYANTLQQQGERYDQNSVARSIARDNAGRNMSNDAAARGFQISDRISGGFATLGANV